MSAVLQALKKIERRRAQTDRMVVPQWQIDPLAITRRRKHMGKWMGAAIAVVLCIGLIILIWQRRISVPVAHPDSPAIDRIEHTLPKDHKLSSNHLPANHHHAKADMAAHTIPSAPAPPESKVWAPLSTPLLQPAESPPSSQKPARASPQPLTPKPPIPADLTVAPAPAPHSPSVERLPDSGIKLQAVVWSDQPDECMAVINDRIMHTGDRIDRYTLVKISANDVLLSGNGQTWRLPFMKR